MPSSKHQPIVFAGGPMTPGSLAALRHEIQRLPVNSPEIAAKSDAANFERHRTDYEPNSWPGGHFDEVA